MDSKMKASKLVGIVSAFEHHVLHSPFATGVRFGCDCGCGGDSYTKETWDAEELLYKERLAEFDLMCETLGVENDYTYLRYGDLENDFP